MVLPASVAQLLGASLLHADDMSSSFDARVGRIFLEYLDLSAGTFNLYNVDRGVKLLQKQKQTKQT